MILANRDAAYGCVSVFVDIKTMIIGAAVAKLSGFEQPPIVKTNKPDR